MVNVVNYIRKCFGKQFDQKYSEKNYCWSIITALKVYKYRVFSGPYFPVFGLNTGKYGPEKTLYLDTFHAAHSLRWNPYFRDFRVLSYDLPPATL